MNKCIVWLISSNVLLVILVLNKSEDLYVKPVAITKHRISRPVISSNTAYVPYWDPDKGNNPGNRPGDATEEHACYTVTSVPSHLRSSQHMWPKGLDHFYQKYTHAYGIPILGSYRVPAEALKRACYTVRFMFADRADVRQSYYKMFGRFAIMATSEVTSSIPEHRDLGTGWDQSARGLGATWARPVSSGAEENALCYDDDRYRVEDILMHEFAHGVHLIGARLVDRTFESRLKALYNNARATGLWRNTYAMSTSDEYFAEGVQSFFNVNGFANPPDGIHNHVNTNEKLRSYDPSLYALISEIFPCGNQYIKRCMKDRGAENTHNLWLNCNGGGGKTLRPIGAETTTSTTTVGVVTTSTTIGGDTTTSSTPIGRGNVTTSEPIEGNVTTITPIDTTSIPIETTSLPIGGECADNDEKCPMWAASNQCFLNPIWMLENCRRSCRVCSEACTDNHEKCAMWASQNECALNPTWMLANCRKSCRVCIVQECRDYNESCKKWAGRDECKKNPLYMLRMCRRSCGVCQT